MKMILPILIGSLLLVALSSPAAEPKYIQGSGPELDQNLPAGFHRLQIGEAAPDFQLMGIDDKVHTLAEYSSSPYLLVVFLSNHCPYSHAAETRLIPWVREMQAKGLGVIAIQPNHPDALSLEELDYSRYNDSFPEMKRYAAERQFPFPYLYDGETQTTTKRYGAMATPDLFLFDRNRRLCYSGRFDDSRFEDPKTVTHHDAIEAMSDLLAGKPIAVPTTRPMGCSVKWLTKIKKSATGSPEAWDHVPITLEHIDAAGVAALVKNPTKKLRLINVWATWCSPCVDEFPDIAKMSRRFKRRDFEVITLSLDRTPDEAKALHFLEKQQAGMSAELRDSLRSEGRTTNNYLYSEASSEQLIQALDPQWPGPIPHTVLIAPGGKILWSHNGVVDSEELVRHIMDVLGGYYPQG